MTRLNNKAVSSAWDEAYALKAQIERNEAERNKPVPTLTIRALLAWSGFWAVVMYLAGWMAS